MNIIPASIFNPNSENTNMGFVFERRVMRDLEKAGLHPVLVSDWLERQFPDINQVGLNATAKMMGDIMVVSPKTGAPVFIECCSMNPPPGKTRFTTSKPENFNGLCRWYALGYPRAENVTYIRSSTWNKYVRKTDLNGAYYVFPTKYINSLSSAIRSSLSFAASV